VRFHVIIGNERMSVVFCLIIIHFADFPRNFDPLGIGRMKILLQSVSNVVFPGGWGVQV